MYISDYGLLRCVVLEWMRGSGYSPKDQAIALRMLADEIDPPLPFNPKPLPACSNCGRISLAGVMGCYVCDGPSQRKLSKE
jgi:hypothetical protein